MENRTQRRRRTGIGLRRRLGLGALAVGLVASACERAQDSRAQVAQDGRADDAAVVPIDDRALRWVFDGGGMFVGRDASSVRRGALTAPVDGGDVASDASLSEGGGPSGSAREDSASASDDASDDHLNQGAPCEGAACTVTTAPDLLVAFIGDQGNNGNSDAVLRLIADEGAQAVVHNGDFDYDDDPEAWEARIDRILGPDYPYFSIIGNHDVAAWRGDGGYAARIAARHARVPAMQCEGELGVQANCVFRGLHLIESCIGTDEFGANCDPGAPEQLEFIEQSLASSPAVFRICNWHKNQHDMQVGGKRDEVGWQAYRLCMNAGAVVATGHQHCYARTLNLTDVGNGSAGHGAIGPSERMTLTAGQNFVLVSGLAGVGIRDFQASHDSDTWWASYYAGGRWLMNEVPQQGEADYGALFIRFHVDGDPRKARGYFKDVTGRFVDEFVIEVR